MPNSPAHLTEWTLEQLAEGVLPPEEAGAATEHLQRCARCSAELDAFRVLVSALSDLPRFAPSAAFADGVMARVRMAPATDPVYARVVAHLPQTRRGWAMLVAAAVAPALPLIALLTWVLTQPLVSIGGLWQYATGQVSEFSRAVVAQLVDWSAALGLLGTGQSLYDAIVSVPLVTLGIAVAVLAVAIPLSAWSLVRLVRAPMGNVTYAN